MTLQPGQNIAQYRLLELIGEGGMGRVFRARDSRLHRQVAIKVLLPALTADAKLRRRFMREARAAAAVSHPAIASIHEVGEEGETTYIVMEFVEGRTLRKTVDGKPLPLSDALRMAVEIGEGLAQAHKAGVIHRDLKPDNIIIRPDRRPKILDFGIAKLLDEQSGIFRRTTSPSTTSITGEGHIVGTLGYMSPEQARGDPVDARTDVFSFGVILYEMVAGQAPFKGRTPIDTLTSILKEPPPPVERFNPKVHPRMEEVLKECLEKDPEKRYQTMEEVLVNLRVTQLALQEAALRRTTFELPAVKDLPETATPVPATPARPRRRALLAGLAAAALIAAVAAGLLMRGNGSGEAGPAPAEPTSVSLAVVGFQNLSDPADSGNLGRALAGLITTDLAEAGGLKVASTAKVHLALKRAGEGEETDFDVALASEAARIAGSEVMLVGQVTSTGDGLILAAELVDVGSGNTVGSLRREAASSGALISLAGAIASDVRRKLGIPEPPGEDSGGFDLKQAVTSSQEAYAHYVSGEIALHQARWSEAIGELKQAVERDPTFALAYYRLAMAQRWIGRSREAQATMESGEPYVGRLPERWQTIYRSTMRWSRGDRDGAYDALASLAGESSEIPDVYYLLGEVYTHSSRHFDLRKARESFQKAIDLDPAFKVVFYHLIYHDLDAGDLDAARRLVDAYRSEVGDDAALAEGEVALLFAEGDLEVALTLGEEAMARGHANLWAVVATIQRYLGHPAEAYRLADEALKGGDDNPGAALVLRAAAASDQGRLREALADLKEAAARFLESDSYQRYHAAAHVVRARILSAAGRSDAAVAAAREALKADPWYAPGFFWLGRVLLEAGRVDEARQALADLRGMRKESLSPPGAFWERLLQAEIHREDGDLGSALAELGKASLLPLEHRNPEAEWMTQARVKAAFGDLEGAVEAWRECLRPRIQNVSQLNMATPLPWYHLALLEEEAGDAGAAREHLRRFLQRWGEADLPVAAVEDARARIKALR